MTSTKQTFAKYAMQQLAGVDLNPSLESIFTRILSRQVQFDEDGVPQTSNTFVTLLQVFTFVATPATEDDRPASPFSYGERVDSAIDAARELINLELEPEPEPEPILEHTSYEQFMLELVNRARIDPLAEAARYEIDLNQGLDAGTLPGESMQPVFSNPLLIDAARDHSDWMLASNIFSHTGEGGSSPGDRMEAAGYAFIPPWTWGENVSWKGTTGALPSDLTDYILDQHESLFLSPGHRENLLNEDFREIGIGQSLGEFTPNQATFQASMITQNFAASGDEVFLGGVVYRDFDGDDFYTPGEGLGSITISLPDLGLETQTSDAGGYQLAVPSGTHEVVFSGAALDSDRLQTVTIGDQNEKLDLVLAFNESDEVNIFQLDEGEIDQTWVGVSDERDIFVVPIQSDNNGAFAAIGNAVIQDVQQAEGDAILFVDTNNQWNGLQEFLAEVQPQSGNATILFNNNPEVAEDDQTNSLQIEGAMTTLPFANTPSDIANVDMHVVTEQEVNETGSIEHYVDLWLA